MTLAEIRKAVRSITKDWGEEVDTLLPTDNLLLDIYINWACEDVVLDLVEFMPEDFLTYEDISLVANQSEYDLTAEWISVWAMHKNVSGESYQIIPYSGVGGRDDTSGETASEPDGWFLKGTTIVFWPKPSVSKTDYVRCWIIAPETASVATTGPASIPRMAHKLVVLDAAVLVAYMADISSRRIGNIVALYKIQRERVKDSLTNRVQQQPQFVGGSCFDRVKRDTRHRAFYDKSGFFR